jgi:hypothetical protein
MALDTYADLQSTIIDWLARDPTDTTDIVVSRIQDLIRLSEVRIARELRVRCMQRRLVAPMNEPRETLPARFLGMHSLAAIDASGNYRYLSQVDIRALNRGPRNWNGDPYVYARTGNELHFGPFVQGAIDEDESVGDTGWQIELVFWSAPVSLSAGNPTNDVLTTYPNVYLYAGLVEAGALIVSDQLPVWTAAFSDAVASANDEDQAQDEGPVALSVQPYLIA